MTSSHPEKPQKAPGLVQAATSHRLVAQVWLVQLLNSLRCRARLGLKNHQHLWVLVSRGSNLRSSRKSTESSRGSKQPPDNLLSTTSLASGQFLSCQGCRVSWDLQKHQHLWLLALEQISQLGTLVDLTLGHPAYPQKVLGYKKALNTDPNQKHHNGKSSA